MLITFKSKAGADVIMFGEPGQLMLRLIGKDENEPRGIVTAEQLPAAIAALQAAVMADKAQQGSAPTQEDDSDDDWAARDKARAAANTVSLAQRAAPLIELLTFAQQAHAPVLWES